MAQAISAIYANIVQYNQVLSIFNNKPCGQVLKPFVTPDAIKPIKIIKLAINQTCNTFSSMLQTKIILIIIY